MNDTPNPRGRIARGKRVTIYTTLTADQLTRRRREMLTERIRAVDRALDDHDSYLDTPSGKQSVRDVLRRMRELSSDEKPTVSR